MPVECNNITCGDDYGAILCMEKIDETSICKQIDETSSGLTLAYDLTVLFVKAMEK